MPSSSQIDWDQALKDRAFPRGVMRGVASCEYVIWKISIIAAIDFMGLKLIPFLYTLNVFGLSIFEVHMAARAGARAEADELRMC